MVLDDVGLLARLMIAALLGAVIGLERELSDRSAGLRTHLLVSLGSAMFTLVGAYPILSMDGSAGSPAGASYDPTRLAAQVITGVGFLGAGAILRQGLSVHGLTTAATLWVASAIGVAVGLGRWRAAVTTSLVTVVA